MTTTNSANDEKTIYEKIVHGTELFSELLFEKDDYDFTVITTLGRKITREKALSLLEKHPGSGAPAHLYFHLPFCSYLCRYCNYVKTILPSGQQGIEALNQWTEILIRESQLYLTAAPWLREARIESIYFGGGTAALLGKSQLQRLLDHIKTNYTLAHDCEISLEGNPENFLKDEASLSAELGINRFSIGIQSFDHKVHEFAGRTHRFQSCLDALKKVRETGKPFNVDLIYGLPFQSLSSVLNDVNTLLALETPQVTVYRLRNADRKDLGIAGQALWNLPQINSHLSKEKLFPELNSIFRMRAEMMQAFVSSGYHPGPCAWWSRPGTYPQDIPAVSRNKWWKMDTMIGVGPGAYGWLAGGEERILQLHHSVDITDHASRVASGELPLISGRLVSGRDAVSAAMGFNYKAFKPVSRQRFITQFGIDPVTDPPYCQVIDRMLQRGFFEYSADRESLLPTLLGEAFHEEILKVYFNNWMAKGRPPSHA